MERELSQLAARWKERERCELGQLALHIKIEPQGEIDWFEQIRALPARRLTCARDSLMLYSGPWQNHIQLSFPGCAAHPSKSTVSFISGACWTRSGLRPQASCRWIGRLRAV